LVGLLALLQLTPVVSANVSPELGAGDTAPSFELPAASDATLSLEDYRGRVVVLNFWATWCAPCIAEMPLLNDLHDRMEGEGLTVLGVNIDRNRAPANGVIRRLGVTMPTAFDPNGEVVGSFGPTSMPATFIIDREGTIRQVIEGSMNEVELTNLEANLRLLLSESATAQAH
jgi:peroxiredoxin